MTSSPPVHRISDFARPRLPLFLRAANVLGRPFARRVSLDPGDLLAAARRKTGLDDFGDDDFREPMQVLLSAMQNDAALTPFGRFGARQLVLQLLTNRLRAEALVREHPEILDEEVRAPVVILGLPRTGTTHLHNLLAQDDAFRSLPYWESLEPVPQGGDPRNPPDPDPRYRRCVRALGLVHKAMPLFPLMHEMEPDARHEEIQLLAIAFRTMLFEASYQVPSYRDWYLANDQTPGYRYLRRLLQLLQWLDGKPRRWLLKSPQHMEQLGPLFEVFPDARVVQTHRDPVRVTASFVTMGAYGLRLGYGGIDPRRVGTYWADRIEHMLRASVEDRTRVPEGAIRDVRFDEFMKDESGTLERIYAFIGQPYTAAARAGVEDYRAEHGRGRLGRIEYRLEDFGVVPAERRRALAFYSERFGLPDV